MPDTTLGAARTTYYQVNGFGDDGGDALAWVPIKLWRFTLKIPNTDGRRRAVRFHDLHHVVTGFQTDLRGEAEIAAWELASGCLRWPAATMLNLSALAMGLVLAPRRMARAWALGRRTKNLYREDGVEHLLPQQVDEVRARLGLDRPRPPVRLRDVLGLAVALPVFAVAAAPILGVAALVA
ncbi:MAG: hypothetical protein H0T79_23485 [Deltaproteobacteria bacterium]|nr:hypothetical protein [Deltaproteobacteria bacterium]